ncbi:MAG TPA: branched-chain amino acid ABC transporter permease [Anaerolineae bacterium]|nr:branched-chain amino acid ABC transporter permease [Caldilineae bacterium]HID33475.1 branched-chain amino acid ABC transporter permease [Anaerolineae bacterium]HIQ12679.1 branched-chain amino acid ABC transporter permease [Caldilineales bacterium]
MKRLFKPGLLIPIAIIVALAIWPLFSGNSASAREAMFTLIMSMALASSLNIILGYTGYVSFGHIVFFGIGGYAGFWVITHLGWHILPAALLGGLVAAIIAWLLGLAVLRLRGAYFALATIGILEAMKALVINLDFLGGPVGLEMHFSEYKRYGGPMESLWMVYWSMAFLAILVIVVSYFIKTSKFGLGLMAIREDEDAAEVMGVITPRAKTWAYVLSAVFPGIIGVLFFFKNGNIEPGDAFRLHFSIEWIVMLMLGGAGTVLGPVLGGGIYQWLRKTLLTSPIFKDYQLVVAGVMLLIIVLFVPTGIIGWVRTRSAKLRRIFE